MCTIREQLRNNRETAQATVDAAKLQMEIAKVASKYFAPYRAAQLAHLFEGADDEQLEKEISAFNEDTKNGTRLIIALSNADTLDGNTIKDKDGKELYKNVQFFATLDTTDKDGNVVRSKSLYSCPFTPMSANDNDRVIDYWLSNYRNTVEESFAYLKEVERAKEDARNKKLLAAAELLGVSIEDLKALQK